MSTFRPIDPGIGRIRFDGTVVVDATCERHRIVARMAEDPRVVFTECGLRVALVGHGCHDPVPCPKEAVA